MKKGTTEKEREYQKRLKEWKKIEAGFRYLNKTSRKDLSWRELLGRELPCGKGD